MVMKDNEQIDDFCMKVTGLVTNIRALGQCLSELYVVKKILRAAPTKFLQIVSTMEQFSDMETLTVEETVGALKAHEERLRGQSDSTNGQLMMTQEEWSRRERDEGKLLLTREEWLRRTEKAGGDSSTNWKGRVNRDKSKIRCFNYQLYGHYAADCRRPKKVREFKQEANMAQVEDEESALLLANHVEEKGNMMLLNEMAIAPKLAKNESARNTSSSLWYLDNGASNHMTRYKSKFRELNEDITGKVRFGDGSTVKIEGKGMVILKCKNGEDKALTEVYYIPTLCSNIISIGQLSEEGNRVIIKGSFLWIYDN
ncbi:uncharacterized protein LOC141718249 [Apium graveolens]|uniref:uncharacterized protein LOC141718249 n=1 Tax=Apium graveolens TaxID=4045 RepID=UPI003D7B8637